MTQEFIEYLQQRSTYQLSQQIEANNALASVKDEDGLTALHVAAERGEWWFIYRLLALGADVNAALKRDQKTALHIAAEEGNFACVEMLFTSPRIERNALDHKQQTPLHLALRDNDLSAARFLIYCLCDVSAKDLNGVTPLHLAALADDLEVTELLLQYGADPSQPTKSKHRLGRKSFEAGTTPRDIAGAKTKSLLQRASHTQLPSRVKSFLAARASMEEALRDIERRFEALRSLRQYGPIAATVVAPLMQHGHDPILWKQMTALLADEEEEAPGKEFAERLQATPELFFAVGELLLRGTAATRQFPAHVLGGMKSRAIPALPVLSLATMTRVQDCQWPAIQALGEIGQPESLPVLLGAVRRHELGVTGQALEALLLMGDAVMTKALLTIIRLLKWLDDAGSFRGADILREDVMKIFIALGEPALKVKGVRSYLKKGLLWEGRARLFTAWACYRLLGDLKTALPILSEAARSEDEDLFIEGLAMLSQLPNVDEARETIEEVAANEDNEYAREIAKEILQKRGA